MEMIDIFNDVLTTERRPSQEIRYKNAENEQEHSLNFSKMSFYINPAYSASQEAKPYTISSKYINKKSNRRNKSSHATELNQLLALAEIRFLNSVHKIKQAIVSNKKIHLLQIIDFIRRFSPIIKRLQKLIKKKYWYKWICISREFSEKKVLSQRFKVRCFLLLWKQVNKRNLLRAFVLFRERSIMYEFGIQYYGIESISKKKLSKFVPPFRVEEPNKVKLDKIASTEKSNILQILKEPKQKRSYFHK